MIRCCNSACKVKWYHFTCIGMSDVQQDDDWWCSDACERSGYYVYCTCGRSTTENDNMVQCELAGDCLRDEWYHPSCLCIQPDQLPGMYIKFIVQHPCPLVDGTLASYGLLIQTSGVALMIAGGSIQVTVVWIEFSNTLKLLRGWH